MCKLVLKWRPEVSDCKLRAQKHPQWSQFLGGGEKETLSWPTPLLVVSLTWAIFFCSYPFFSGSSNRQVDYWLEVRGLFLWFFCVLSNQFVLRIINMVSGEGWLSTFSVHSLKLYALRYYDFEWWFYRTKDRRRMMKTNFGFLCTGAFSNCR